MSDLTFYAKQLYAHAHGKKLRRSVHAALIEDGYLTIKDGVETTTHAGDRLMLQYLGGPQ